MYALTNDDLILFIIVVIETSFVKPVRQTWTLGFVGSFNAKIWLMIWAPFDLNVALNQYDN